MKERFRDDCKGFKSKEECEEYWNIPPIRDENAPPGTTCRDEGDPDDRDPGLLTEDWGANQKMMNSSISVRLVLHL
ncbi:MAG TPA: hypothetical protein VKA09_05070 [Nitrososphaeraceae archaeon]|nr:hypothetical protein [Nitrososphaeraceae archaeon]